jgi:hypothetical protein
MAATPLTKPRPGSVRAINRDKRPIAAVKVQKGGLAACVAGFYQPVSGDPDEVAVGRFYQSVDNSAGAAGDKSADIQFFRERNLMLVDNDGAAPVVVADRELPCSFLDDHTATLYSAGSGSGAIVYDVTSEGVWVEFTYPASSDDAGVPRTQKGTTTLVAGTKIVTGVVLTANSNIQLSMRDPGAGALTTFIALDAPVASRNTGTGQFVVNAIDNAKAVLATAVCTVDYLITG